LTLCKGVIFDGVVLETEVTAIAQWLEHHPEVQEVWPADVVVRRVQRILHDGMVEDEEREDLRELLMEVTGSDAESAALENQASTLPLDNPAPTIHVPDSAFCFTGRFYFGTRRACQSAVTARGGLVHPGVRRDTHYLVIGQLGSTDWIHSSYGTKIQKAVEYRERYGKVKIVCEQHWGQVVAG
jgi:NAD-dependent DNA ligase